jgi:FemAB-related protein (PEP-CTERM system-associated)
MPLVAWSGRRIVGVLPICSVPNPIFGACMVSTPLAVYGGICAVDRDTHAALLEAATQIAQREGMQYVELRNRSEQYPTSLPRRDLYVTFTQDLSPGPEKLLHGLPRDTRYAVRKSQKAGLEWTEDITLDQFYEVYARSVHRLGTPVFPKNLFAEILKQFPKTARLFGVRKGNKVIAAVMCLYFRDQVLPYYGGSLAESKRYAASSFMYWNSIVQSCHEAYRLFDFGRSKKGTGSYHFKAAWAMRESELPYRYQLVRANKVPQLSPIDKQFQLPVAAWKRLPFSWTKVIGPRLVRWLPSI